MIKPGTSNLASDICNWLDNVIVNRICLKYSENNDGGLGVVSAGTRGRFLQKNDARV